MKYNFKLLEQLKLQGLTQQDLAKKTNLTPTSIHHIINSGVVPKTGSALKIAKALNKKVSDLFDNE